MTQSNNQLAKQLAKAGITRTEVARVADRTLGHVCMSLNGQRPVSGYLARVMEELIRDREARGEVERHE